MEKHTEASISEAEQLRIRNQPPSKKPRTAAACQRCKSRKQKCDGDYPSCLSCRRASQECLYISTMIPKAAEQKLYVKALEERIAQLESNLSYSGISGVADDHLEPLRQQETTVDYLASAIRGLTLNASGYSYLGGTSNITLARLLEPIFQNNQHDIDHQEFEIGDGPNLDPLVTRVFPPLIENEALPDVSSFSNPIIETLFRAYIKHVSLQFPVIHSRTLRDMHSRRNNPNNVFEICVLHLVYAIGGRTLELCGMNGDYSSDDHYEAAMAHRARIMQCIDRRSIQFMTLASMYCLRSPRCPGPWTMIGLAVKLCISLGFHRKSCTSDLGLSTELDKRLFWTCYVLDREITLTMGRPPSLSDHDIDTTLPLEINEDSVSLEDFRQAATQDPNTPTNPPTTLSYFIHVLRLKRITSDIQHTIYRVDKNVIASHHITDDFLDQLDTWKQNIPLATGIERKTQSCKGHDPFAYLHLPESYMIQHSTCIRFLLFPQLTEKIINPRYLNLCAKACAKLCRSYKQLHQYSMPICYLPTSIISLFLTGLTLIHCMWNFQDAITIFNATEALTDCTIMLYVMNERWPKARRYRRAFEQLKVSAMKAFAEGKNRPAVNTNLEDTPTGQLDNLARDFGATEMGILPFSQMMQNISGEIRSMWENEELGFEQFDELQPTDYTDTTSINPEIVESLICGETDGYEDIINAQSNQGNDFQDWSSPRRI